MYISAVVLKYPKQIEYLKSRFKVRKVELVYFGKILCVDVPTITCFFSLYLFFSFNLIGDFSDM